MEGFVLIVLFCVISSISASCVDENNHCAKWARNGMCNKNQKYMSKVCQLSCNVCETDSLKFITTEWTLPGTFPGAPPIKFKNEGDSLVISCRTNDPEARTKLFVKSDSSEEEPDDTYVPAVIRLKGRITVTEELNVISNLKTGDQGKYKCVARKGMSNIELFKGSLIVRAPATLKIIPTITPSRFVKVARNSSVEINCSSTAPAGSDKSYLKWYVSSDDGDLEIPPFRIKKYRLTKDDKVVDIETLLFNGFEEVDIGQYVCKREGPDGYTTFAKLSMFMKGFCYIDGELHATGVRFISLSCTGYCKCDDPMGISCVSLCPPHYVICPPGQIEVAIPKKVLETSNCSCPIKQCVNITDHCYFEGKLYTKGERFVSNSCTACKCDGLNSVSCVSLCPARRVTCRNDQMEHFEMRQPSPGCYCKVPTCLNITNVCKMEPESGPCYALFRRWHYDDVTQACKRFDYGGCEGNPNRFVKKSICENTCKPGITRNFKKVISPGDCEFEGKWYKLGENFISYNCKSNCTCADSMKVECEMLCPPQLSPTICGPGEMLVLKPKVVNESPKCFCEEGECVNTVDVCKMKPEAGSCYAAHRRWHYNPSSQRCLKFIYGGCEGNPNNFLSKGECRETCGTSNLGISPAKKAPKVVTISGKIQLSPGVSTLPNPSCASVKLIDKTGYKDYHQASSSTFSVSDRDISNGIDYQLLSTSHVNSSGKSYSLTAVVNVGWCKSKYSTDWIRGSDYVTKDPYDVVIDDEKEEYNVDVDVTPI